MASVIEVANLRKFYKKLKAVDEVSFQVQQGEIFGIVGPNGAGKTTTVECIEGLRVASSGEIAVLGLDPVKQHAQLKEKIGIQLQESQLPDRIKVWEALDLFGSLFKRSLPYKPLLKELGLEEKANDYFDHLSGGQKQRLSIAMSLINDPQIVFFDELTTGLDPQARRNIWDLVKGVQAKGKTVILVTHFMEEAEKLCDRVAIIDAGKVIALDTPKNLIHNLNKGVQVDFSTTAEVGEMTRLDFVSHQKIEDQSYEVEVADMRSVAELIRFLTDQQIEFEDFHIRQPNLEDVFIELTGKEYKD